MVPRALVFQLSADLSEIRVRYRFGKQFVFYHFGRSQILNADIVILHDQIVCHLVCGIPALIPDVLMQLRDLLTVLFAVLAVLWFS